VSSRTGIPRRVRDAVLSDDAKCAYCGFYATVIDHVVPWSRGGTHALENLAPACWECNAEKHDKCPDEWAAWRTARGKPWPVPPYKDRVFCLRLWLGDDEVLRLAKDDYPALHRMFAELRGGTLTMAEV
jgi:hypothetical protein